MKKYILACQLGLALFSGSVFAGAQVRVLLEANFNSHIPGQAIGTGGPELGEPVTVAPGLFAMIRLSPRPPASLELNQSATGLARKARFEFIDSEEIISGDLRIRMVFHATQLDRHSFSVRETGTSAQTFLTMTLTSAGDIDASDANGFIGTIGQYTTNTDHQVEVLFHMDAGTYDIELDGLPLISGRGHGVTTRGVGALLVGPNHEAMPGSLLYVDNIRVTAPSIGIFRDGFE